MEKKRVILSWYLTPIVRQALYLGGFIDKNGKVLKNISSFLTRIVLEKLQYVGKISDEKIRIRVLQEIKIDTANRFNKLHEELREINAELIQLESE